MFVTKLIFNRILTSLGRWLVWLSLIVASFHSRGLRDSQISYWIAGLFEKYYQWFNIWYSVCIIIFIVISVVVYLYESNKYQRSTSMKRIHTWFEDLIYPIMWLWASKWAPIVVKSFEQYKDEYLFLQWWLHVTTIIDSSLKQYKVWSKESLVDIWKEIWHEYIYDWVDVDLDYIKNIILENIQYINKYYHDWILERIKSTTSFVTLVNAIDYYPLP